MKILFALVIFVGLSSCSQWIKLNQPIENDIKITFHLALKLNMIGVKYLENLIINHLSNINSKFYGNYLSNDEIISLVSPSMETISWVKRWLKINNIKNCEFRGDSIKCTEEISKINDLFDIKMEPYFNFLTKKTIYRSDVPYKIPYSLIDDIIFVEGLSNPLFDIDEKKINYRRIGNDVDQGIFSREVMYRLYNITDLYNSYGKNVSIGSVEYFSGNKDNGFSNIDLITSQMVNGADPNPITPIHQIGINSIIPDFESELDVQMMYWGAPNAELWYESYDGWMYGWANDFFNRLNIPEVVSISWGWSETKQCAIDTCTNGTSQQYIQRCNIEFMKIIAMGVTIVAASGDAGSPGRTNELCISQWEEFGWNNINPTFPGGSPWVLSVGGTYIVRGKETQHYDTAICTNYIDEGINCANGISERGIYYNETGWTTGGGFTHWDNQSVWQREVVKKYLESGITLPDEKYFNCNGRAYPDISAVGHNCLIAMSMGSDKKIWYSIDGTSCSTPVIAGIISQLNYFRKLNGKPVVGFVNPLLYKIHREVPTAFNDITVGVTNCTEITCCNKNLGICCTKDFGFSATKGWDPVSGLGTPNVGLILDYLGLNK